MEGKQKAPSWDRLILSFSVQPRGGNTADAKTGLTALRSHCLSHIHQDCPFLFAMFPGSSSTTKSPGMQHYCLGAVNHNGGGKSCAPETMALLKVVKWGPQNILAPEHTILP
ncbi:hypothetical protein FKM82_024917 [Ascaphus truei]